MSYPDASLIKVNTGMERVGKQIAITNKLLQTIDPILIPYRKKDKWGFCTPDKKIVIDCVYEDAERFSEGLAKVRLNGKYGFINKDGKVIIPIEYESSCNNGFRSGLVHLKKDNKEGFLDTCGNTVIPFIFDGCRCFYEVKEYKLKLARIINNNKVGLVDSNGQIRVQCIYDDIGQFSNGLACVKLNGKFGYIDIDGFQIIQNIYDDSYGFRNELARVKMGDKYGFIDTKGNEIIPLIYDFIGDFKEGLATVEIAEKYGFIDKNENIIIPCIYDFAMDFSDGYAIVGLNTKIGYINKYDLIFNKNSCDDIYEDIGVFLNGLARFKLDGKYGFLDNKLNIVVPNIYLWADEFKFGLSKAYLPNGQYGYINKSSIQFWEDDRKGTAEEVKRFEDEFSNYWLFKYYNLNKLKYSEETRMKIIEKFLIESKFLK